MAQFTRADLDDAIVRLGMLEFFPADPKTRSAISVELAKMCPHREALEWLIDTMVAKCPKWRGIGEVRALLSTRHVPADGIEGAACSIPGHTPADCEARYIEQAEERKALEVGANPVKLLEAAEIRVDPKALALAPRKVFTNSKRITRPPNPEFEAVLAQIDREARDADAGRWER